MKTSLPMHSRTSGCVVSRLLSLKAGKTLLDKRSRLKLPGKIKGVFSNRGVLSASGSNVPSI